MTTRPSPRPPSSRRPPTAAPARSGRTPRKPFSVKDRDMHRSSLLASSPATRKISPGHPFVGPAGQLLTGRSRSRINRREGLHYQCCQAFQVRAARKNSPPPQKPNTPEIRACRQWYERELASIKPGLVVAMGATAAQSVFSKITPINKNRGRLIDLNEEMKALVTVHPSYLLRLPDEDARAREYERFVDDLKIAAAYLRKSAHAA